ncbi:MAG TPA: ATP-dependent 6-phosphofructokinase [Anaerolineaceae bacterium]|nr:ATP-dependent 6-phosphofructokinase [Anaerolineaceae bacterium]
MSKKVGLLTAGGDSPGVNAAIRGFGKAITNEGNVELIGFRDGFTGLVEDRTLELSSNAFSGILTQGGTILGISRSLPQAMPTDKGPVDMTDQAVETYKRHKLDALVCIGGKETIKAGLHLSRAGLNVITIPKAADNDLPGTDKAIGFDTAREIATQAIDRLHTTATATHRIMIVELMGLHAGWLTLGAGLAAGADVILIPEFPYDMKLVVNAILDRKRAGRNFSLVAVAENARSQELVDFVERAARLKAQREAEGTQEVDQEVERISSSYSGETMLLARRLREETGLETRITILGSLVRGGTPTAADRLLATQLAEWSALMVVNGQFGRMARRLNDQMGSVPLEEVVDRHKVIPPDHAWIRGAYQVGTCLGVVPPITVPLL